MQHGWRTFVSWVAECVTCKNYPRVQAVQNPIAIAWNNCELPDPRDVLDFGRPRVFFISEAPPGGSKRTFFYCNETDPLRVHLFEALGMAEFTVSSLQDFFKLNCYLLPSFCYPCASSTGTNSHPSRKMVERSATRHLGPALDYIQPDRIVLLGECAAWAARAFPRSCFVTYWPTKRLKEYRQEWRKHLVPMLKTALTQSLKPQPS